jgi:SagB-type dehydrogenase family enzyme
MSSVVANQFWADELSLGIFYSARFDKVWWKYKHSRSYKDTYCDAGHLSQTFQLCATALGLSTWITGYFRDDEATEFLKITELCEAPLFFVGAGFGPPSPLHPLMIQGIVGE